MNSVIKFERNYEDFSTVEHPRRLQNLLPYCPDCTSDINTQAQPYVRGRPRKYALKHSYIQLNPKSMQVFITLDLDYDCGEEVWDFIYCYGSIAAPYFIVGNTDNGHAHLIYVLRQPVCTTSLAHFRPLKYLKAIIDAYTELTKADGSYTGHLSKNPWSNRWRTLNESYCVYDLQGLVTGSVIDIFERKPTKKPRENVAGLGRNCSIFEHVRTWAYREIRNYWKGQGNAGEWQQAVEEKCNIENRKFDTPLFTSETRQIAKSIANWTWRHITPEGFSDCQRRNVKLRWNRESKKPSGLSMLQAGFTTAEIAELLGVSQRTCQRWNIGLNPTPTTTTITQQKPWLDLGISRRTWYRLQSKEKQAENER